MNSAWSPWTLQPGLRRTGEVRPRADELARLWASAAAREVVVDDRGRFAVRTQGELTEAELTEGGVDLLGAVPRGAFDPGRHVLLGTTGEGDSQRVWFASRGEVDEPAATLRDVEVDPTHHEVATAAVAVLAWHDTVVRCEKCGAATTMAVGGFQRQCVDCGAEAFPRHDPAMIVAVLDDQDRLLLAHQASWATGRVSILAGFCEAGESVEHTVVREVFEEVGLEVTAVQYLASQPWPFPRSLMLGFVARARGEVRADEREIAWARWFTRPEFEQALASGEVTHPPNHSIASRIIALWRAGQLPRPEQNELLR